MIRAFPSYIRAAGLALVVLLAAGHSLKADEYTVTYGGGPGVTVNYTNPSDPSTNITGQGTMAIPFGVTDNTTSSGPFTGYCVDLYHDQYQPSTFTAPAYSVAALAGTSILSSAFPYTAYTSDLASRLNYVGSLYNTLTQAGIAGDQEVAGALQLGLWTLVDKNFSYTTSDTNLIADTNIVVGLLGAAGASGTGDGKVTFTLSSGLQSAVTLSAYSTTGNYSSAGGQLILSHPTPQDGGVNQNLLTWGQGHNINITGISAPEPSTFALSGLGALAFMGYALRRRAKA